MKKHPLWPFFLISLFFTFYASALLPELPVLAFAPFLILTFNRYTQKKSLWIAGICGLLVDLLTSLTPFGFHALIYSLVTLSLYRFRLFFVEKALGLSGFTLLFSLLSTLCNRLFLPLFGIAMPWTWQGALTDLILMPLFDSLYAFLWFSCPLLLYDFFRQQWFRFHFFREELKKRKEKTSS